MSAGAINGAASDAIGNITGAFGKLSSEDFIKVMVEELSNQDPFEPQDSGALLEQLSSLRNIESQFQLQDSISSLVLQNQMSAAGGLIGKVITGLNSFNDRVEGLVTSVRLQGDDIMLELDSGHTISMESVEEIRDLSDLG